MKRAKEIGRFIVMQIFRLSEVEKYFKIVTIKKDNQLSHMFSARNKWSYAICASVFCVCTYNFLPLLSIRAFVL